MRNELPDDATTVYEHSCSSQFVVGLARDRDDATVAVWRHPSALTLYAAASTESAFCAIATKLSIGVRTCVCL